MLVLSRKPLERICIGDSVVVTVVRIDGNTVRLGIEAPRDISVFREELLPESTLAGGAGCDRVTARGGFAENSV
jgi:carbon storage regulator